MGEPDIYVFSRDRAESLRLNRQHRFLTGFTHPQLLHDSIDPSKLQTVAEIATGTGIWLRELAWVLKKKSPVDRRRYFHGFDISPKQFPADTDQIKFTVHNVLKPFPKEHWARYDVVHVRLLIAALRACEYKQALENIMQILKPGGYLQWQEIDQEGIAVRYKLPGGILIVNHFRHLGFHTKPFLAIEEEAKKCGFQDFSSEIHTTKEHPNILEEKREYLHITFLYLLQQSLSKGGGMSSEEVERVISDAGRELERRFEEDQEQEIDLVTVTCRRPDTDRANGTK